MYVIDEKNQKQKFYGILSINISLFIIVHELVLAALFIFVPHTRMFLLYYVGISAIPVIALSIIGLRMSRKEQTKKTQQITGIVLSILAMMVTLLVVFIIYLAVLLLYMVYLISTA